MNAVALPDVSLTESSPTLSPLQWVVMQGIDLPITVAEPDCQRELHARADVQVDLPTPHVKGIHMSRRYRLLDDLGDGQSLSPIVLRQLLDAMVASHRDCQSRSARLRLRFDLLARRPALITEGLAGWKAYPIRLDASVVNGSFTVRVMVSIGYSSTCPYSATLSRQLIEQGFLSAYGRQETIEPSAVAAWLRQYASLATPHSQRSEAQVTVDLAEDAASLGLLALIDQVESAVGTPVQTAVKRADEQAFAALNGQNLMFVEDIERRIQAALSAYARPTVHVRHLESLPPHDAVVWASPDTQGVPA